MDTFWEQAVSTEWETEAEVANDEFVDDAASANLPHRVDGSHRGSAGPVYSVASHLKVVWYPTMSRHRTRRGCIGHYQHDRCPRLLRRPTV
jgi:hypothetical protein